MEEKFIKNLYVWDAFIHVNLIIIIDFSKNSIHELSMEIRDQNNPYVWDDFIQVYLE